MGVFSEMHLEYTEKEKATGKEAAFVVQQQDSSEPVAEVFADEEKQQAEADSAKAVLDYLNKDEKPAAVESAANQDPAQLKKEHEEKETKRKAEWEAKQKAKEEEILFAWENATAVSDDQLTQDSMSKISTDTERLTRRNMKICVSDHIQNRCRQDADFARYVLHPRKNMINCFRYITSKAKDFIQKELEENGEKISGMMGGDVPDDICYQWAEEYFLDLDAEIDKEKEEKFVPKPYTGPSAPKGKKAAKKETKKEKSKPEVKPEPKTEGAQENAQLSLAWTEAM